MYFCLSYQIVSFVIIISNCILLSEKDILTIMIKERGIIYIFIVIMQPCLYTIFGQLSSCRYIYVYMCVSACACVCVCGKYRILEYRPKYSPPT